MAQSHVTKVGTRRAWPLCGALMALFGLCLVGFAQAQVLDASQSELQPFACQGQVFVSLSGGNSGFSNTTLALFDAAQPDAPLDVQQVGGFAGRPSDYNALGYNLVDGFLYAASGEQILRIGQDFLTGEPAAEVVASGLAEDGGSALFDGGALGDVDEHGRYWSAQGGSASRQERSFFRVVDLADPRRWVRVNLVEDNGARAMPIDGADMAFNPIDGTIWIKHLNTGIMVVNVPDDLVADSVPLTAQAKVLTAPGGPSGSAGASWFDSAGNFYSYFNRGVIYRYPVDYGPNGPQIGQPQLLTSSAPNVQGNDAAACPYRPVFEKSTNAAQLDPGDQLSFTFSLRNVWSRPIEALELEDDLSAVLPGAKWQSADLRTSCQLRDLASGAALDSDLCQQLSLRFELQDQRLRITNLDLPAKTALSLSVSVQTPLDAPLSVCGAASLNGLNQVNAVLPQTLNSNDPSTFQPDDATCVSFSALPNVTCEVLPPSPTFTSGTAANYRIVLSNQGDGNALDIELADGIPVFEDGTSLPGATLGGPLLCSADPACANVGLEGFSEPQCPPATQSTDSAFAMSEVFLPAASIDESGRRQSSQFCVSVPINFDASVAYDALFELDPDGSYADGSRTLSCRQAARTRNLPTSDLSVSKSDNQERFSPGEPLTYELTIHNAGPSDVRGARLSDQLDVNQTQPTPLADPFDCQCAQTDDQAADQCNAVGSALSAGTINQFVLTDVNVPAGCTLTYRYSVLPF